MRVALVAREVYPYVGGGIAPIVSAAARLLSQLAQVTVVTSGAHRAVHERLRAERDPRLLPEDVQLVFVDEPDAPDAYLSWMHHYSARVDRALRTAYPDQGPELIEFCDYLAEGFVTIQARHTRDPWLENTLVCVRLHTTSEFCAVLDGHLPDDFETTALHDAERYCLRHADRLLWSGGDVLAAYQRYYGVAALAPAERIADAFLVEGSGAVLADDDAGPADNEPLRLLYLGRYERRKGPQNLLRAFTAIGARDLELSLLGADTATGPVKTSLRAQLELMAASDSRIRFVPPVSRSEVGSVIRSHHAVVVPSLWECWPNVGREALMHNRPLLATPVGGLTEMVVPGRSGWLTRDASPEALADAIERLLADRTAIRSLIASRGPRSVFERIVDPHPFLRGYERLVRAGTARQRPARRTPPLVSIVVPYFRLEEHVDETIESALSQQHRPLEIVVVNDGSLRDDDRGLWKLADRDEITVLTQVNTGLSAARNFGIRHSRGRYVLPLDADDVIEPAFLTRCVDALESDPDLAYVATWVEYMEPDGTPVKDEAGGYIPFGNWSRLMERNNVGGTCSALLRRRLFEIGFAYSQDLTSYEDWMLYRQLARAGYQGAVIPERLFRYRVRPASMMRTDGTHRTELIMGEMRAQLRETEMRWTAVAS